MTRLPGEHALDQQVLRKSNERWRLVGSRCASCGKVFFPPRTLCADDLTKCEERLLSTQGTVYEASHIRVAPVGFTAPYWIAYVDLPEGVRLFAQLDWRGDEPPRHGDAVECTVRVVRTEPHEVLGPVFTGPQ
ncbi:MAG: hypothetical protein GEU94_05695 [Micromonosporaceae bacterium]|nr:hypothetical protein [Micromonosporaceae bacterium]